MSISRRDFLAAAAIAGAGGLVRLDARRIDTGRRVFQHGIASGDPLADRVVLWTRVTAPAAAIPDVRWEIAGDPAFRRVAAAGSVLTGPERDFTVKVDAGPLRPGTPYYYRFSCRGERSPVGRTRTLPPAGVARLRLALVSCSNLPYGYFNVYRRIAGRNDLDAVLHLGDYIYEYENGRYGDGAPLGRIPEPNREIVSLADYRMRHAQYKRDPDLQAIHRQHPFIAVWDDHEFANNTWRDGATNHQPERGEGDWSARRAAAVRAYREWMPIRDDRATLRDRVYRSFAFGDLASLVMLDTRLLDRDQQSSSRDDLSVIDDPRRTLLGAAQERWLFDELSASSRAGARWHLLGQQVMFAPASRPGASASSTDNWDGYRPARDRVFDAIAAQNVRGVIVLTGDVHSSWAYDLPRDPWDGYDRETGAGSLAVEFVTPAVSSPTGFGTLEQATSRMETLRRTRPHLRFVDGLHRGYVVLDVTHERAQADWFFVPTVTERSSVESYGGGWLTTSEHPRLIEAPGPAGSNAVAAATPAPEV